MHISEAAARSQLPAKTIRYYEEAGLIGPTARAGNGYREYSDRDVHVLRFVQRARSLGFAMQDCRELLSLYNDKRRSSADVKAVTMRRLLEIERKLAELESLRAVLSDLGERCRGDHRPDSPILDDLAGSNPADSPRKAPRESY
ncbi:MAG: Cu(I)-responsive transcriptional regulator [Planctomycetota bacterium]|jgi:Cu(I)-responsive transcriptional regulator